MSLSPIIGAATQVLNLFGNSSTSSSTGASSSGTDPLSILDSGGNVNLSQAAQFFSKLQDLSQTDGAKFQQLTAKIATQLQTDAQQATGSEQSFLTNLANQFNTASQTGSASALEPQATNTGTSTTQTAHHGRHQSASEAAYTQALQGLDSTGTSNGALQNIYQQLQSL
jgi:hypothetical protein